MLRHIGVAMTNSGAMSVKGEANLIRRGGVYYLRARVPVDLHEHYGTRTDVRVSLRTKDKDAARRRVRVEREKLEAEWARLRAANSDRTDLTDAEIARVADAWLADRLREDADARIAPGRDHRKAREANEWERIAARRNYAVGVTDEGLDLEALAHLESYGIPRPATAGNLRKLVGALAAAEAKAASLIVQRDQGEPIDTPAAPLVPRGERNATVRRTKGSPSVSDLFDRWAAERQPREKTRADFNRIRDVFVSVNGDLPAASVTKAHMVAFKDHLLDPERKLSPTTVWKHVTALRTVLRYAAENDLIPFDPSAGVRVARSKRKSRFPYSVESLNAIFASPIYTRGEVPEGGKGPAAYWLPLLAIFTGARLEELAQLRPEDVGKSEGVPYLSITDAGEGQKLKTEGSRRRVPLHPELVRLGFVRFTEAQRKRKAEFLFDQLRPDAYGIRSAAWSKWWGRYSRQARHLGEARGVPLHEARIQGSVQSSGHQRRASRRHHRARQRVRRALTLFLVAVHDPLLGRLLVLVCFVVPGHPQGDLCESATTRRLRRRIPSREVATTFRSLLSA